MAVTNQWKYLRNRFCLEGYGESRGESRGKGTNSDLLRKLRKGKILSVDSRLPSHPRPVRCSPLVGFVLFVFWGPVYWTQGPTHARQILCKCPRPTPTPNPPPLCKIDSHCGSTDWLRTPYFAILTFNRFSVSSPDWPWVCNPLALIHTVAWITNQVLHHWEAVNYLMETPNTQEFMSSFCCFWLLKHMDVFLTFRFLLKNI